MKEPIFIGTKGKTKKEFDKKGNPISGKRGGDKLVCRILRPSEFMAMYNVIARGNQDDLTNFTMCLLLGARYEECRRIQSNPKWYDGNIYVHIKEHKVKRVVKDRYIRLSNKGKTLIRFFFTPHINRILPCVQTWDEKLKRWAQLAGITDENATGITSRMMRKTWESWLMFYYPTYTLHIMDSQGHTLTTSAKHYTRLPFDEEDAKIMKEWLEGWNPEERK